MTEQEYAEIAAACDRLLRAPATSLARLAIPALHFLNEHPSSLAQYAPVLAEAPDAGSASRLKAAVRAARGLTRSLSAPRRPVQPTAPVDVVIVSHLLKAAQLHQANDFYFGALQSHLQDLGLTSLLVLVNHLRADTGFELPQPTHPRTILPRTVSAADEAGIWRQCTKAWRSLRREAASASSATDGQLAILASQQVLSAPVVINLRMHAALSNLCHAVNPKIVITTYEGTVAERLIWHAARTAQRRPLCVGYQHAMVLKRAHAIRRPVAAPVLDCDPDVVLTLGEISHKELAASAELSSLRLIEYGSHRRASLPPLPHPQHRPPHCLVLPDASDRECATLFYFALDCARQRPDISFALRPHPMIDTQSLLQRHPVLQKLPANVSLSVDAPLEQEVARARYCLYRGSSAALHAVRAGIKPYYVSKPGELPFDCLSELTDWRETVTSPEDLIGRVLHYDPTVDSTAASRAADVCERYISPVRPAALEELLTMLTP